MSTSAICMKNYMPGLWVSSLVLLPCGSQNSQTLASTGDDAVLRVPHFNPYLSCSADAIQFTLQVRYHCSSSEMDQSAVCSSRFRNAVQPIPQALGFCEDSALGAMRLGPSSACHEITTPGVPPHFGVRFVRNFSSKCASMGLNAGRIFGSSSGCSVSLQCPAPIPPFGGHSRLLFEVSSRSSHAGPRFLSIPAAYEQQCQLLPLADNCFHHAPSGLNLCGTIWELSRALSSVRALHHTHTRFMASVIVQSPNLCVGHLLIATSLFAACLCCVHLCL